MGFREEYLEKILIEKFGSKFHKKPESKEIYKSDFSKEIEEVYKSLKGKLKQYPTGFRGYDICCKKFIIELDEERHFNQYRLTTLSSDFYNDYHYFDIDNYKVFCKEKEKECLAAASWGGNWKNIASEQQFGESNIEGCLVGNGSSRWKQRAFYDFLRDVSSHLLNIPIFRISIYEKIDEQTVLDDLLRCRNEGLVKNFISKRINEILG